MGPVGPVDAVVDAVAVAVLAVVVAVVVVPHGPWRFAGQRPSSATR